MPSSTLIRANKVLRQAQDLSKQVKENIIAHNYENDDTQMNHYNTLLRAARSIFPKDIELNREIHTLPDSTLRAFPMEYLFAHPDIASRRLEANIAHFINQLNILISKMDAKKRKSETRSTKESSFYEKGSPADVAVRLTTLTWNRIKPLSESKNVSDRLLAFNVIIFILIGGIAVTHFWLNGVTVFSFGGLFILVLSFLISFIVSNLYLKFIELLSNLARDKIGTLRIGSVILMTGIPLVTGGLFFNLVVLTGIALAIVLVQFLFILSGMFFYFPSGDIENKEIAISNFKKIAGNVLFFITIADFLIAIVLLISTIVRGEFF
jgi:multisubunit Na+/H+ antiporter MnhF subunit